MYTTLKKHLRNIAFCSKAFFDCKEEGLSMVRIQYGTDILPRKQPDFHV